MGSVVVLVVALLVPAAAIAGAQRSRALDTVGPVVLCYAAGIGLANVGLVPSGGPAAETASLLQTATVALAIPLLLVGTDLRAWSRLARSTVASLVVAIVAVVVATVAVTSLPWLDLGSDPAAVAGMTVGVYTGGTANMAAVAAAIDVPEATFVALNAADLLVGALYLVVLLSVGQRLLARILPAPPEVRSEADPELTDATDPFAVRPTIGEVLRSIGIALVIVAVVGGAAMAALSGGVTDGPVLDSDAFATAVVLGITTAALLASFLRPVREQPGTYATGQYLFLVFAVAIGTLADLDRLLGSLTTFVPYLAIVLVVTVTLHVGAARVLRLDHDTVLITSTATVFGPPFVGPVAAALRNPAVVPSGMTAGVLGIAVGNYVGLGVASLLA